MIVDDIALIVRISVCIRRIRRRGGQGRLAPPGHHEGIPRELPVRVHGAQGMGRRGAAHSGDGVMDVWWVDGLAYVRRISQIVNER
jgi:hypothetical protein